MAKSEKKKFFKFPKWLVKTWNIFTWVLIVFCLFVTLFTIVSMNFFGKDKTLLGYSYYIVLSDSMNNPDAETYFAAGDIVVTKKVDTTTIKPGDIITFVSEAKVSIGQTITHMVREVSEDENGKLIFITYGINTGVTDETPVHAVNVKGVYQFKLPKMGTLFNWLKTPAGFLCLILIPFALILSGRIADFARLFRQYRAEQKAELTAAAEALEAERAAMEAEKNEAARLKEELEAMRAAMQKQADNPKEKYGFDYTTDEPRVTRHAHEESDDLDDIRALIGMDDDEKK